VLRDGVNTVRAIPRERWDIDAYYDPNPDANGKMYTRWAACIDRVDEFEPQFFGIAPREAIHMDPQQRLLLEVSWEALEHAGLALAGGVHVMLSPENDIAYSRSRMAAFDGRCKTFDAAADGFVSGEGCGVVVLKRLSDAVADGDRILAVIRGSAVNQDGPSSG